MNSTTAIPFTIDIPSSAVDDLRARLANTRWPEPLPGHPWQRGVPIGYVKELANYWLHGFDWPKQQTLLNRLPQFTTLVDGQTLHFLHIRSRERSWSAWRVFGTSAGTATATFRSRPPVQ